METVRRLAEDGLLVFDGARARLTARGRLISNEVFQEFLATGNRDQMSEIGRFVPSPESLSP
jgi:coproporphyrinogen III oxidase-like Fe-S oxidoreductase